LEISVEEMEVASPRAGEVLVRLVATGVCHSDLGGLSNSMGMPLPLVLGHEGAGVVEEVGPGVTDLHVGDHVVLSVVVACGRCFQCRKGAYSLCEVNRLHQYTGTLLDGTSRLSTAAGEPASHFLCQSSLAEYAVVPRVSAIKVRDDAPLEAVCLLGCGAMTGIGAAIRRGEVRSGESIVVFGVGGVGLAAVMGARLAGAYPIIAVDRSRAALDLASDLGATHPIDASTDDVVALVTGITTRGADLAVDAVGAEGTVETCLASVREGGQVVVVGISDPTLDVKVGILNLLSQKRLTGSGGGSMDPALDIPRLVDLFMDGRLPLDRLVKRTYDLDGVSSAFEDMHHGEPGRGVVLMS
jgi:Zn-dependent alcohol dehydrogenase